MDQRDIRDIGDDIPTAEQRVAWLKEAQEAREARAATIREEFRAILDPMIAQHAIYLRAARQFEALVQGLVLGVNEQDQDAAFLGDVFDQRILLEGLTEVDMQALFAAIDPVEGKSHGMGTSGSFVEPMHLRRGSGMSNVTKMAMTTGAGVAAISLATYLGGPETMAVLQQQLPILEEVCQRFPQMGWLFDPLLEKIRDWKPAAAPTQWGMTARQYANTGGPVSVCPRCGIARPIAIPAEKPTMAEKASRRPLPVEGLAMQQESHPPMGTYPAPIPRGWPWPGPIPMPPGSDPGSFSPAVIQDAEERMERIKATGGAEKAGSPPVALGDEE